MLLAHFNSLGEEEAALVLRPFLDIPRWGEAIVSARPFPSKHDLLAQATRAAGPFTPDELDRALRHHPRIGERASGESAEARHSRAEQAGIDPADTAVRDALDAGNRTYEERFDRVFLIRAAGRSPTEILDQLRDRLGNDAATEEATVGQQLREIAVLRLEGAIDP